MQAQMDAHPDTHTHTEDTYSHNVMMNLHTYCHAMLRDYIQILVDKNKQVEMIPRVKIQSRWYLIKRWVFKALLKPWVDGKLRMLNGREFQRSGAQNANERSPYIFVLTRGTFKMNVSDEDLSCLDGEYTDKISLKFVIEYNNSV